MTKEYRAEEPSHTGEQLSPEQLEPILYRQRNTLLYTGLSSEKQIEGFQALLKYQDHPDDQIQKIVSSTIDDRWKQVGLYQKHIPGEFSISDRAYFTEDSYRGNVVEENDRVAILLMAERVDETQLVHIEKLKKSLLPYLGAKTNIEEILEKLNDVYVIDETNIFQPLVVFDGHKVQLTSHAISALAPHLSVLRSISLTSDVISDEEALELGKMKQVIESIGNDGYEAWKTQQMDGLAFGEQSINFLPHFSMIEVEIQHKKQHPDQGLQYDRRKYKDIVAHTDGKNLFVVRKHDNRIRMTRYKQSHSLKGKVLQDFWGNLITGKENGSIIIDKERGLKIKSSGEFKPMSGNELDGCDEIEFTPQGVQFHWENLVPSRDVFAYVNYQGTRGEDTYFSRAIHSISLPVLSKRTYEGRQLTSTYELTFENDTATIELPQRDGKLTISYKKSGNHILIRLAGANFRKELSLPKTIDPESLTAQLSANVDYILETIATNKEDIRERTKNMKALSLMEHIQLHSETHIGGVYSRRNVNFVSYDQIPEHIRRKLVVIDSELNELDDFQRWIVKTYMACLAGESEDNSTEESKVKMRNMVMQYNLDIPELLLEAINSFVK